MEKELQQPIIWVTQNLDGSKYAEFDEELNNTIMDSDFLKEHKHEFEYIGLIDCVNDLTYSINLNNGKLILNGQEFDVAKELKGVKYNVSGRNDIDYRSGVIQYKCSKPMVVTPAMFGIPIQSECRSYNIGYKVTLPEDFLSYNTAGGIITLTRCQAEVSVDADTLQPSISVSFSGELKEKNGRKTMIRI